MGSSCNSGDTLHGSVLVLASACLFHEHFSCGPCVGPLLSGMVLERGTKMLISLLIVPLLGLFVGFISHSGFLQVEH